MIRYAGIGREKCHAVVLLRGVLRPQPPVGEEAGAPTLIFIREGGKRFFGQHRLNRMFQFLDLFRRLELGMERQLLAGKRMQESVTNTIE
jgi:hypothetical protein